MRIGSVDLDSEVLIVAEIGNNHEGHFGLAEELIVLAANAGAQAVKFQTIKPEKLVSPSQKERIAQLNRFRFSDEQFRKLKQVADREKILFLSTPFDIESALFLNDIVPAFKISSGDINFFPLLDTVARTGKPLIISSGMSSLEEVRRAKEFIESIWQEQGIRQELAVLHCVSSYPTTPEEANLISITVLGELGVTIGYSDHTVGIEAAVLSVALGARIIEKHFTIDKNYSEFRDHKLSVDPAEMAELVRRVKVARVFMGDGEKRPQLSEANSLVTLRRSIAAGRSMRRGHRIEWQDLTWLRPAMGLPPGEEERLLGKVLRRDLETGEPILPSDLD